MYCPRTVSGQQRVITPAMAAAVAVRPRLWSTAIRAAFELAPRGWWKHRPHLPLPDPEWTNFRIVTAYGGDGSQSMRTEDLVAWLDWKRAS